MDSEDERINQMIQNRVTIAKRVLATDRDLKAAAEALDQARAAHASAWRAAREGGITERELSKQLQVARPTRGKTTTPRRKVAPPHQPSGAERG